VSREKIIFEIFRGISKGEHASSFFQVNSELKLYKNVAAFMQQALRGVEMPRLRV